VILGLTFSYNLPLLSLILMLGIMGSIGLGFIGLGLQLVYKQTAIVTWVLFTLTGLLGNMIVPVQLLPGFAQTVSYLTPQYYFFTGVRVALGSDVTSPGYLVLFFGLYV